ncbi:MAG: type II toxin-antitoxin system TacA family antitoxin [Chloroflexota bacterium]
MAATGRPSENTRRKSNGQSRASVKDVRLGARVTRSQKEMLQRAADLTGRSLTDFVVSSALDKAQEAIHAYEVVNMSERDARAFFAALENPPRLDAKMEEALAWHRKHVDMR